MKLACVIVAALCLNLNIVEGLKILAVFPYTGKSHHYVFEPLINKLASKGHEVTLISHYPSETLVPNRTDIKLITDMSKSSETIDLTELESIPKLLSMVQVAVESEFLYSFGVEMCHALLTNEDVQKILKEKKKFDIALMEHFNSDCLLGLANELGLKTVGITSDTMMPWHFERFGVSWNPSYVPCHNLGYGIYPVFRQRISSLLVCSAMRLGYYLRSSVPTHDLLRQYVNPEMPTMDKLTKDVKLLLVNAYFPLSGSFLLPPNVREIGGLYLKEPNQLPEDLEQYIKNSPHGVIYFSMGSMIKGTSMSREKLHAIQSAFAELPQRVLWKWENDTMPGIPSNVMVRRWLPQMDILSHKNVKAFITHGGMLSTTEAVHCGVPIISIPLFGDQFANAAAAEESGLGLMLEYKDITKETFLNALRRVLDPKMQQSAKRLSAIWRDRPLPPLETAVYWIEHVARHGGSHLRPVSADLPMYKYLLLDVIGFLAFVCLLCLFVSYKILQRLLRSKPKPKKD